MKSNIDVNRLENCAQIAKEIHYWLISKDHPEHYHGVRDLELIRNFLHVLDLLETVLVRFEISAFIAGKIFGNEEPNLVEGSLLYEFGQIDVEEYFASSFLEYCYQLSNACQEIIKLAEKEKSFLIFSKEPPKLGLTRLARHKATHFDPANFEKHTIAHQYSILRRPYKVVNGKLEKELARFTMPRVANLVQDSVIESQRYLTLLREATIG